MGGAFTDKARRERAETPREKFDEPFDRLAPRALLPRYIRRGN